MTFAKPITNYKTFSESLFSLAGAFGASTVYVKLSESQNMLYEVFVIDPVLGHKSVLGRVPGKTFFVELRNAGVILKASKPSSHLRFRTSWLNGKRHQARLSYAPASLKERRQGVLGVAAFDSMKTYHLKEAART